MLSGDACIDLKNTSVSIFVTISPGESYSEAQWSH